MIRYLVRLTPLGAFTFGTDQNYAFPGENYGKPSYIADTNLWPEQTTILGMLRYEILRNKDVLKEKNEYAESDWERIRALIGSDGFDFSSTENTFGMIESISPVFIQKRCGKVDHFLIKTPFNHINIKEKNPSGYEPICMNETVVASFGDDEAVKIPGDIEVDYEGKKIKVSQYNAKRGYSYSLLDITTGQIDKNDIFTIITRTGNWVTGNTNNKDGLFKVRQALMKEGYSFGVEVEVKEECFIPQSIVQMGKNGSMFKAEFEKIPLDTDQFEQRVEKVLCNNPVVKSRNETWYYALSDLALETTQYRKFCMVEEKSIRNIEKNGKRSQIRQNLVKSGSVFFEDEPKLLINNSMRKIGYNSIIKIKAVEE